MPTPTGISVLDRMLRGGFPDQRAILLMGGPGTGKTTLAMQYLQEGLERNQDCLFISTEQTPAEIEDSFASYDFDLDHERLQIQTIHATVGSTVEDDGAQLVLDTLDEFSPAVTETSDMGMEEGKLSQSFGRFQLPYTNQSIQEFLQQHSPCDRIVFDSISELEATTQHTQVFRRAVLDFIRLFTDHFEATAVFTAEETSPSLSSNGSGNSGMLQFNTHGVIRLWHEQIDGDFHRFIQVKKMRGVNHSTKPFEMEFDHKGVHVVPERRTPPASVAPFHPLSTGIGGPDDLCGGGLIKGGTALLEHDGRANINPININTVIEAIRDDQAIVLLPPASLEPKHLDSLLEERVGSLTDLLQEDRLFVLDLVGNWTEYNYNVFSITEKERLLRAVFGQLKPLMSWRMKRIFRKMNDRRDQRPALIVTYTDAMLRELTPKEIRQMHQWGKKKLMYSDDTVLFVQNPNVMDDQLSEFFVLDSRQMLKTWMHERGLQYLKLEKSPMGDLGSSRLVKHVDYPPYVRVQRSFDPDQGHRTIPNSGPGTIEGESRPWQ